MLSLNFFENIQFELELDELSARWVAIQLQSKQTKNDQINTQNRWTQNIYIEIWCKIIR